MKKEDFNIMRNIQVIEELKAELVCIIGDFFKILTREVM
ncbi:MazG-like family [Clostridium tetanomorphum]|nr:MazG-like family [Clostridium tetanomorphum]